MKTESWIISVGLFVLVLNGGRSLRIPDSCEEPVVETGNGRVRGYTEQGISGRPYFAFKSIPYAEPPIGQLRFKAPRKPSNWSQILEAKNDPPACLQKNTLFAHPRSEGTEDCLYLNVYTPKINRSALLPVMVFIHWGGFFTGYSNAGYLGADYLLERRDIVLVTFSYRLGVLGFLSTNDDNAPGNYGLKDQQAVLRWVQDNIENFGGNRNKVTLFGQSAGAASVHYQMLSPLSKGLFHHAISQSGSALALWAKPMGSTQKLIAAKQGQLVGCSDLDESGLIECLRKVPADVLVESSDKFKEFSIDPLNVFLPSVEKKTESNPEPFITKQPVQYILDKEFSNIPWIVGLAQDEGRLRAEAIVRQSETREQLNERFDNLMPKLLQLSSSNNRTMWLWGKIKQFYLGGKSAIDPKDTSTIKGMTDIYTDRAFAYATYQSVQLHRLQGHERIWFYNFNYTGGNSYGSKFAATNEMVDYKWDASHCDDLIYIFRTPALFENQLSNPQDVAMKDFLTDVFINFAENGDPNPRSKPFWEKLSVNNSSSHNSIRYLDIEGNGKEYSPDPKMKEGIHEDRLQFWEEAPLLENIEQLSENHIDI